MGPTLICGLGSVGRRHLRNLVALGVRDIVLLRSGRSTLPSSELDGFPTVSSIQDALARFRPEAAIISNPTALHLDVAIPAADSGCDLFIEKPLSNTMEGVADLVRAVSAHRCQVVVGYQFRFHPGLREVDRLIREGAIGAVASAHAHWGEYLPGWHPWEDYRTSYSARAELGGGVLLTLCHPFDYLRWLLGDVVEVSTMVGRSGALDIDVEDTADVHLRFVSGAIASVHLDYVQRPPSHWLRLTGTEGTISWDNADGGVKLWSARTGEQTAYVPPQGFERNAMFVEEMRHFLACVRGQENPEVSLEDGVRALELSLAAKASAESSRFVRPVHSLFT